MGIKLNTKTTPATWEAFHAKRHPITRMPVGLRRKGIKSKAEAQRIFNELVVQVEDRLRKTIIPSWGQMIEKYLVSSKERGLMSKTLYASEKTLKAHTGEWMNRLVDSITTQEIRDLLHAKLADKSEAHKKYVLKCIKAVFACALDAGYVNRNPSPMIKFKLGDKIKAVLTEDQAKNLLFKAKELNWEWYYHYALALYTGMRTGELYALTWDKIDLDQRTVLVNCSWNNVDGIKSTKSGDDRIIEIAQPLLPILRELKGYWTGSDHVLPRNSKWDKGEQARELRHFLLLIGMQPIRFHDLRASWATLLLSKGVEPIKVMKMGGWRDLETMMIYARKAGVDIKGATDCLNLDSGAGAKILKLTQSQ
jgi:integrase